MIIVPLTLGTSDMNAHEKMSLCLGDWMRLDGTAILGCNNDMQRRGVWCYEKAVSCFCAVTLLKMDENLRRFHLNLNGAARQ